MSDSIQSDVAALLSVIDRFSSLNVWVVGDLMLDEYIYGRATRISQEAPVMVIRQTRFQTVPGGAANVAANLRAQAQALLGNFGATSFSTLKAEDYAGFVNRADELLLAA